MVYDSYYKYIAMLISEAMTHVVLKELLNSSHASALPLSRISLSSKSSSCLSVHNSQRQQIKSCRIHGLREYSVAIPYYARPALYCIFSTVNTATGLYLATKSVDLWRNLCASLLYFVVRVYDVVVKKFRFAISSPDELLVGTIIDRLQSSSNPAILLVDDNRIK